MAGMVRDLHRCALTKCRLSMLLYHPGSYLAATVRPNTFRQYAFSDMLVHVKMMPLRLVQDTGGLPRLAAVPEISIRLCNHAVCGGCRL